MRNSLSQLISYSKSIVFIYLRLIEDKTQALFLFINYKLLP